MMSKQQIERLAKRRSCPRCSMEKTEGNALCRRCRFKLPAHMRQPLEEIVKREEWIVAGALRAAASYLEIHFKTIRHFGGGRPR
jgi:predicted amidophosphoribosyltransferase